MVSFFLLLLTLTGAVFAQTGTGLLRIYFIDVEGGQSTLVVAPSGETLLIDAGWEDPRDARRIEQVAKLNDLAPTRASLLSVQTPSGSTGRVLHEIFSGQAEALASSPR